jgi:hypothetical protein
MLLVQQRGIVEGSGLGLFKIELHQAQLRLKYVDFVEQQN